MKIFEFLLFAFFTISFLFTFEACTNDDNNDSDYLYLPQRIQFSNFSSTDYTYDTENKIVKIAYGYNSNLAIISTIKYNSNQQPQLYTSNIFSIAQNDSILLYTLNRELTYSDHSVAVTSQRSDGKEVPTLRISLDNKGLLSEKNELTTGKYTLYELDANENIVKTIDQDSTVSEYTYDNRRGIFREVNIPAWFIQAIISMPVDSIQPTGTEIFDIRNNHLATLITKKTDSTDYITRGVYTNIYGGFWYPTQITYSTNKNNTAAITRIKYTAVNK